MMNEIQLSIQGNEPVIDSRIVAKGFGIEHHSLCKALQEHFTDLKSIKVSGSGPGRPGYYYLLTERQVMIIPAICKTTTLTVIFQRNLVDAFIAAREALQSPTDPKQQALILATQLLESEKEIKNLKQINEQKDTRILVLEPKAAYTEEITANSEDMDMEEYCKQRLHIGFKTVYEWLRELQILMSNKKNWNLPYQRYIDMGYFSTQAKPWKRKRRDGTLKKGVHCNPIITPKGQEWIHKTLVMKGYIDQPELFLVEAK
jgi:phage antirepressor YoqD-like protein